MQNKNISFDILKKSNKHKGRLGILNTKHGLVKTPAFIFCATKASVKGVDISHVINSGTQIILSNTYHLMLLPGSDVIYKLGGLQKCSGWNGPMLTDSGGFQIFSFGHGSVSDEIKGRRWSDKNKSTSNSICIKEGGAFFRSYLDGSIKALTPEISIQIQHKLGADIILVLDECTPFNVSKEYTKKSMMMSHRWSIRSLNEFNSIGTKDQKLYGIVQGGIYEDLRRISCDFVNERDGFFGFAIGGSLGQSKSQMNDVVGLTAGMLDASRPKHLLGIGGIADVFFGVRHGIDTFDCVHPTRIGRHGCALVKKKYRISDKEHINLKSSSYKMSLDKIEDDCDCYTCKNHSRGYINHLIRSKEILACTLVSIHNIRFMNKMFEDIRLGIENDNLDEIEKLYN